MPTLSSACDFMMGLGKIQRPVKFEVSSPSRCRNIIRKPQKFDEPLSPRPPPLFRLGVILLWVLANPSCISNLKSLASAVAEILKGKPQILGSSPNPGSHPLFLLVRFDLTMGLSKLQLHAKFEVAGFICYGSIRESVFKRHIRFLSDSLGS